jgi:hypothetical protein
MSSRKDLDPASLRLRVELQRLGFQGKFEVRRVGNGGIAPMLFVIPRSGQTELPLKEFEGMNVYLSEIRKCS